MPDLKTAFVFVLTVFCAFECSLAKNGALIPERTIGSPYNTDDVYSSPLARQDVDHDFTSTEVRLQQAILASADSKYDDLFEAEHVDVFAEMVDALEVMQSRFFKVWLGTWPNASDWTGAVMGTHVAAALKSITSASPCSNRNGTAGCGSRSEFELENFVNRYFSQLTGYYFGEHAFQLRLQGNDDMLWVVLGWLESIKLLNKHSDLHHRRPSSQGNSNDATTAWYGKQYEPAFAHRSHVFYDAVAKTWETELCGGGLTWNPHLRTYKNTITNTQYIAASAGMFLFHPGDNNTSPFLSSRACPPTNRTTATPHPRRLPPSKPREQAYLDSATTAYTWLRGINLTNAHGLYVDGYHLAPNSTRCTLRNEAVYTYNQGVLLSGLRHLYSATREAALLRHGHALVRSVVRETHRAGSALGGARGRGVLHEFCDGRGRACGQDALAFKGIFFLHFAEFCQALDGGGGGGEDQWSGAEGGQWPRADGALGSSADSSAPGGDDKRPDESVAAWHARQCTTYTPWVARNARAALRTRKGGVFGAWWDAPRCEDRHGHEHEREHERAETCGDANDAGLGRTVETQAGGLAVLRAWWELTRQFAS